MRATGKLVKGKLLGVRGLGSIIGGLLRRWTPVQGVEMSRRNLILIHRGADYERDFEEIAQKVNALDKGITIYQLSAGFTARLPDAAWEHPTLTVAMSSRFGLKIRRGPVLKNGYINKLEQARRARASGVATPPMMKFVPGKPLDPIMFGEFVVIKPMTLTSKGDGVQLFRRRKLQEKGVWNFNS